MNQNKVGPPTALILAMFLGVVGIAVQENPLKSSRPSTLKDFSYNYSGMESVDARLWEDPLFAIESDIRESKNGETPSSHKCEGHSFLLFKDTSSDSNEKKSCIDYKENSVKFLGVTAKWGHYIGDQEQRRRIRYAVISGLAASGYIPVDPTHIGYLKPDPKTDKTNFSAQTNLSHYPNKIIIEKKRENRNKITNEYPQYIPFEIFKISESEKEKTTYTVKKIVLLWLDNSSFGHQTGDGSQPQGPFKFQNLIYDLVGKDITNGSLPDTVEMAMIGPSTSDSLEFWLKAMESREDKIIRCNTKLSKCNENWNKMVKSNNKKIPCPSDNINECTIHEDYKCINNFETCFKYISYFGSKRDILDGNSTNPTEPTKALSFKTDDLHVYSTYPTAPTKDISSNQREDRNILYEFPRTIKANAINIHIDRIIVDDEKLVFSLVEELKSRNIDFKKSDESLSEDENKFISSLAKELENEQFDLRKIKEYLSSTDNKFTALLAVQLKGTRLDFKGSKEKLSKDVKEFVSSLTKELKKEQIDYKKNHSEDAKKPASILKKDDGILVSILTKELKDNKDENLSKDAEKLLSILKKELAFDDVKRLISSLVKKLINNIKDSTKKKEDKPKIVLISETDTLYGRGFQDYLSKAFELDNACGDNAVKTCPIINIKYMKGLDGEIREDKNDKSIKEKDKGKKLPSNSNESLLERPHGNRQYDYLKRMSAKLKLKNQELKKKEGIIFPKYKSNIKAIGILGTDTYDKLLILQEFKKDFPDAIFFTTDLKAHFLHPSEYNSTRNLLVASGFGLELNEEYQGDVPPFRDNYQTATYLATQIAFDQKVRSDFLKDKVLIPKVFEIGRTHAIDLGGKDSDIFHPERKLPDRESLGWKFLVFLGITLSLCFYFVYFRDDREKGFFTRHRLLHTIFLISITLFIYANFKIFKQITKSYAGEPLFWWEGISVWPTNFIRLVSCLFAITFLVMSAKWIEKCYANIKKDFFPESDESKKKGLQKIRKWKKWCSLDLIEESKEQSQVEKFTIMFLIMSSISSIMSAKWLKQCYSSITKNSTESKKNFLQKTRKWEKRVPIDLLKDSEEKVEKEGLDSSMIWENYLYRSKFTRKLFRAIVCALLTFGFAILIFTLYADLPNTPARSDFSFNTTEYILKFTIFSFLILQYYILDEIRLCGKLIFTLKTTSIKWASEVKNKLKIECSEESSSGLSTSFADGWIKINLIARFTDKIDNLIYFPFIILSLMVISRFRFFDDWHLPLPLLIVLSINMIISLYIGFKIHSDAKKAKANILEGLEKEHFNTLISNATGFTRGVLENRKDLTSLQENILEKIQNIQEGAYVPFWERPVLQSIFIPFGGYGGFALMEYALFM